MKPISVLVAALSVGGAVAAVAALAAGQTILVLEGATATVREISGPPDPAFCFYPIGPTQSLFATPGAFPCALPGTAFPGELRGDVAVDRVSDTVWTSDGDRIAEYDRLGAPLRSFAVPPPLAFGPVLGLGFHGAQKTLWVTDGQRAVELSPPAAPCGVPSVASGPILLPPLGVVPAAVTDVDYDPATGTLWVCDAAGNVGNLTRQGMLLGAFPATPGACGLQAPLLGLAVDTASSTPGTLFLTDGLLVATVDPTGAGGATTFGQPFACFPVPGGAVNGLGFSSRPIRYGAGGGVLAPPEIGSIGEAIIPTTSLFVTLSNATPSAVAFLPFSLDPLCPGIVVSTVPVLIFPQSFALLSAVVSASGTAQVAVPIPPGASPGLEAFYQWFVLGGGPSPDGPPILSSGAGSMRLGFQ